MEGSLRQAIAELLGSPVTEASRVSGGDINDAYRIRLASSGQFFVKVNTRFSQAVFAAEAAGLEWLGEARSIGVPRVIGVGTDPSSKSAFLVLEWLEPGKRHRDFDEHLGWGLAALHRRGAAGWGHPADNFIGPLPQRNHFRSTFAEFYRDSRLLPLVEQAVQRGYIDQHLTRDFERLYAILPDLLGDEPRPCRLHGDLWGGNHLVGPDGEPWLIDPAVYGGHREIDLAMMRLFGGFGERVFAAYDEAFPLAPGHRERVLLFQLYPLLVHVRLFGGSYVGAVKQALHRYV